MVSEDDMILFQKFLDCRLREHRKEVEATAHSKTNNCSPVKEVGMTADQRSREMIQKAEDNKVKMLEVPGKSRADQVIMDNNFENEKGSLLHSVLVDEDYAVVGPQVDDITRRKICEGSYVDFARLIPRDSLNSLDEGKRMEFVMKDGLTYLTPASERDAVIVNFNRWEQAFRVFSTIYADAHPTRAKELIQYNQVIFQASLSFLWENVYFYDKDFRLYLSRHPDRTWAIILQQAWTLRMKDRIVKQQGNNPSNGK